MDELNLDELNEQDIIAQATALNRMIEIISNEVRRSERLRVLEAYNKWLLKEGYTDTDIIYELDINDFLKEYLK